MNMLFRIVVHIVLLIASGTVMAQTTEPPPPSLHLPDVVITGRDILQMKRLKELEAFHPSLPLLMDSPFRNRKESITRNYPKEPFRKGKGGHREWLLVARGEVGSLNSRLLNIQHGMNLQNFHWFLTYDQKWRDSYHDIRNSDEKGYDLKMKAGVRPDERMNGLLEFLSMRKEIGYFGSTDSLSRGIFNTLGIGGGAKGEWKEGNSLEIHGMMKKTSLEKSGTGESEKDEGEFLTEFSTPLGPTILSMRSEYAFQNPLPNLFTLGGKGNFSLPLNTTGLIGLGVYSFEKGNGRKVKVYPSLSITYPIEEFSIFLSYDSKVRFSGSESLLGENPFSGSLLSALWDIQNDLTLGFTGRIHPVQGKVMIGIEKRRNEPVWGDSGGVFSLEEVERVSVKKGGLSLEWNILENFSLLPSFTFEEFQDDGNLLDPFPYHSKIKSEFGIRYNPWKTTRAELDLAYSGKKWTREKEEIKPYSLLNLVLSQNLISHFSLWGRAENLINTSYEVWKDYPMPGRSFSLGLEFDG